MNEFKDDTEKDIDKVSQDDLQSPYHPLGFFYDKINIDSKQLDMFIIVMAVAFVIFLIVAVVRGNL